MNPQNTIVLIIGTPKMVPPNFGKSQFGAFPKLGVPPHSKDDSILGSSHNGDYSTFGVYIRV